MTSEKLFYKDMEENGRDKILGFIQALRPEFRRNILSE
jgi:hypothetical protein